MRKFPRKFFLAVIIFFPSLLWCEEKITVAAAASMEKCFTREIIPEFCKENPDIKVEATFDASGKLKNQISQGMKAHVFLSASRQHIPQRDKFVAEEVNLLKNTLVFITNFRHKDEFRNFSHALNAKTVVLGNPDIVPAGAYTKEILEHMGLWNELHARTSVSLASNVTEALSAVAMGAAQCGFVYATDAALYKNKIAVVCAAPKEITPILYPLVLLNEGKKSAAGRKFYAFLQSPRALEIFRRHGFESVIK